MVDLGYGWGIGLEVEDSGEQEGMEKMGDKCGWNRWRNKAHGYHD